MRGRLPRQGLFAGHEWRISPEPFRLGERMAQDLTRLGRVLLKFYQAANLLYRHSVEGKQPEWVARWLDLGKPESLVRLQHAAAFRNDVPRVIRPDLLLGETGLHVTELDSVPGGIGLTAWLNRTYTAMGTEVLGGKDGMVQGFGSIFGNAPIVHIVVSVEAATYRPEMEWMAEQLGNDRFHVRDANYTGFREGEAVYRFFELFDLANVASSNKIFEMAAARQLTVTPPPKPVLEEKMLFALLWNRNLHEFWRRELGEGFLRRMQELVPYTWVMDPSPLPPHGAIPELDLTDWRQLAALSQKQRDLILKVSGFSAEAWGARSVSLGSDLSQAEWAAVVDAALREFETSPRVLQRFHKTTLVDASWFDFGAGLVVPMKGRVRLCPYYFVAGNQAQARAELGGVLATICPADKKIIHGMPEAIFAPCAL